MDGKINFTAIRAMGTISAKSVFNWCAIDRRSGNNPEMPLFYFNVRNDDITEDYEGAELSDERAAHAYAIEAARSLASETVANGHFSKSHYIEIVNSDREIVGHVTFGEAVRIVDE